MIIYQTILAFIMICAIGLCKTGDGVICGIIMWFLLCKIPLFVYKHRRKVTRKDIERYKKIAEYRKYYYNNYGELP